MNNLRIDRKTSLRILRAGHQIRKQLHNLERIIRDTQSTPDDDPLVHAAKDSAYAAAVAILGETEVEAGLQAEGLRNG